MDNIIECKLESTYKEIYTGLWQYDYGQKLRITGGDFPESVEIQFSLNEKSGSVITRIGTTTDGVTEVKIPDELLKNEGQSQNYSIYAYIYLTDESSGNTEYQIVLHVKSRTKPENPSEEPLPEPNIFHETVVAVNASAERAEKAVSDAENIRDNLKLDLSEKITCHQTAEVGQVLTVKEIDESGKPTVFEAEDVKVPTKTSELENDSGFLTEHQDISGKLDKEKLPEAIDDALAQAKESGQFDGKDGAPGEKGEKGDPGEITYVENPYDDMEIKKEIAAKVGYSEVVGNQLLMYADNTKEKLLATLELPSGVEDVQIDDESIVKDGVAEIPIALAGKPGVIGVPGNAYGLGKDSSNNIRLVGLTNEEIDKRFYAKSLTGNALDYAVKSAMCDGKGAAWTAEEQAAARERIGIGEWELFADIALEEEVGEIKITLEEHHTEAIVLFKTNAPCVVGEKAPGANYFAASDNSIAYLGNISAPNQYINFSAHILRCGDYWVPLMVMSNQKEMVGVFDSYNNNKNIAQKVKYSKELVVYDTTSYVSNGNKYPIGTTMTVMAR